MAPVFLLDTQLADFHLTAFTQDIRPGGPISIRTLIIRKLEPPSPPPSLMDMGHVSLFLSALGLLLQELQALPPLNSLLIAQGTVCELYLKVADPSERTLSIFFLLTI